MLLYHGGICGVFALFLSDLRSDINTSDHIQTILGKCGSKYLGGRCRCFKFVYGKPDIFKRCASDYISRFCQWMTFGIAWLSFTGIGFLIYAVNQLSGKYRLGSIVASFFVLLDPVVRWIVLQAYWMYYVSPVSWSSIEHWKILGMERPLNQNIIIPANVIICIVLFVIAGIGTRRKDITV